MSFWEYFQWWSEVKGGGGESGGAGANGWWGEPEPAQPVSEAEWYGYVFGFWYVSSVQTVGDRQQLTLNFGCTLEKFALEDDRLRTYLLQPVLSVCEANSIPLSTDDEDAMITWMLDNGAPRYYDQFVQFLPAQVQAYLYDHTDDWVLLFAWYYSFLFDFVQKSPGHELPAEYCEQLGDEKFIIFADMQVLDNRSSGAENYKPSSTMFGVEARGRSTYGKLYSLTMILWNDAYINAQDPDTMLAMRRAPEPSGSLAALDPDPDGVAGKRAYYSARQGVALSWTYEEDAPAYPTGGTVNVLSSPLWSTSYWDPNEGDIIWYEAHFAPVLFHYLTGQGLPAAYSLALASEDVDASGGISAAGGGDATDGQVPTGSPDHETVVAYERNPDDPSYTAAFNETQVQWYSDGRSGYLSCRARWAQGLYFRRICHPFPAGYGASKISIIPALTALTLLHQGGFI